MVRHSRRQQDALPDGMSLGSQLPEIGRLGRGHIPLIVGILPVTFLKGIIPRHLPTPALLQTTPVSLPAHLVNEALRQREDQPPTP